jgi:hypothetical protein
MLRHFMHVCGAGAPPWPLLLPLQTLLLHPCELQPSFAACQLSGSPALALLSCVDALAPVSARRPDPMVCSSSSSRLQPRPMVSSRLDVHAKAHARQCNIQLWPDECIITAANDEAWCQPAG